MKTFNIIDNTGNIITTVKGEAAARAAISEREDFFRSNWNYTEVTRSTFQVSAYYGEVLVQRTAVEVEA